MDEDYKEVHFNEYCETCRFKDLSESKSPCYECLEDPVNLYSHKPINWEEE